MNIALGSSCSDPMFSSCFFFISPIFCFFLMMHYVKLFFEMIFVCHSKKIYLSSLGPLEEIVENTFISTGILCQYLEQSGIHIYDMHAITFFHVDESQLRGRSIETDLKQNRPLVASYRSCDAALSSSCTSKNIIHICRSKNK